MKAESVFALLAGAAAGAALGILFAPEAGSETRAKLKEATAESAHDLHVRARYARREFNSLKRTLTEQGASLKEDVREKIINQLSKLEAALAKDEFEDETPLEA